MYTSVILRDFLTSFFLTSQSNTDITHKKCAYNNKLVLFFFLSEIYVSVSPYQVSEMAYLKLHSLLQTVLCLSWEEVCFLLGRIGSPLWPGGAMDNTNYGQPETFSHLVPIVRTLLDQHADPVNLQKLLPNLPITNGSTTFAQDLKAYCQTLEWQGFYQQQVSVC